MKKSKSWIHICVHFLLLLSLAIRSYSQGVSPVTDDISKLYTLKHNIPKDYKIPVYYIPKEESGMCWVKLNVFYLEGSLNDLMRKFGNISSNREDLRLFTVMLEDLRYKMESLETAMYEFSCHYRREQWQTEQYFDFIKEYLAAAKKGENPENCIPPPCPTTPSPVTTEFNREASQWITPGVEDVDCLNGCTARKETRLLSEVVERSLFSLLFIPLLALAFLFVWKVRSRRIGEDIEEDPGEGGLFTGAEGAAPPQDVETPEKTHLNICETV